MRAVVEVGAVPGGPAAGPERHGAPRRLQAQAARQVPQEPCAGEVPELRALRGPAPLAELQPNLGKKGERVYMTLCRMYKNIFDTI